jgi:hypothetical protein
MTLYINIQEFDAEELFGCDGDTHDINEAASVIRYNDMLLEEVMDAYPESDDIHIGPRRSSAWIEFDNGRAMEAPAVLDHVRQIGEKLWNGQEFIVFKKSEAAS